MWTAEEYLETWLKCSDRGQSNAQLDVREGGRIHIALLEGHETCGFVEGTFTKIQPEKAVHMHWTLVAGSASLRVLIAVECAPEREGTRIRVKMHGSTNEQQPRVFREMLSASFERMAALLQ
ncbi:MAG: SRPBCC domain-containing protein [Acidobacteriota bacterium]|nr:SRPBCC domain-containing protein [Acidobacteriota bacterium]